MRGPRPTRLRAPLFLAGGAMLATLAAAPIAARAQAFVAPAPPGAGYYYPGPYYGYPPPYPDAYGGAAPQYSAPPAYYPPLTSGSPAPVETTPLPAPAIAAIAPPPPDPTPASAVAPGFGYTSKPAFINASGQTCREYRATDLRSGRPVEVYGTACRQPDGQWRVIN